MLLSCALALAACDGPEPAAGNESAEAPPGEVGGVRLALLTPSRDFDLAAMEGVLRVEGPCVYVGGKEGRGGSLLAFGMPEVRWDGAARRLHVYDRSFAPGDLVVVGGSHAHDPARLPWRQRPDPSCDTSQVWVTGTMDPGPYRGAAERLRDEAREGRKGA